MSSIAWLQLRKAWQLKHASFLTGLPTTGTKTELAKSLAYALSKPVASVSERKRIVSIDMGIKNLGLCVLETSPLSPTSSKSRHENSSAKQGLKVIAWKKINVLDRVIASSLEQDVDPSTEAVAQKKPTTITAFSPSSLADIACELTDGWLKTYAPDTILVERQRFRSGGAAAVQEWTLRVNMLESMLWASLLTLRNVSLAGGVGTPQSGFPALLEVNPARVANFWCSSPSPDTRQVAADLLGAGKVSETLWNTLESKKIEKKDKIAVVRSWLTAEDAARAAEIQLAFTDETKRISEAFLTELKTGRRRKPDNVTPGSEPIAKLDDLADCLLQGVAWVKWEENRKAAQSLVDNGLRES